MMRMLLFLWSRSPHIRIRRNMYGTVTSSSSGGASGAAPPPPAASPFRYVVQDGDTLARVAAKTGTPEATLLALNPLLAPAKQSNRHPDRPRRVKLYAGQQLIVEEASRVSLPPPPDCIDNGWGQMHVVRAGETLRAIAAQYNSTEELLRADNRQFFPAGERGVLAPGQLLHIRIFNTGEMEPEEEASSPTSAAKQALGEEPDSGPTYASSSATFAKYKTHIVTPSDSFTSLCEQYGVSYQLLLQINRGRFPVGKRADLVVGDPIIVPDLHASKQHESRRHIAEVKLTKQIHVVEPGDTPEGLAARYGMTYDEMREFNRAYFPKGYRGEIRPGYKLVVKRPPEPRFDEESERRSSHGRDRDEYLPIGGGDGDSR